MTTPSLLLIPTMDEKLQLLLSYVARGWRIFPCLPYSKKPATPDGYKSATTDISQIEAWHKNNPFYNWAIANDDKLVVIDLDVKGEGRKGWEYLIEEHGIPESTIIVKTGGGGEHWWFKAPASHYLGRVIRWKPGIDVLGDGGYILVPPSVTTQEYTFASSAEEPAELPLWLLDRLKDAAKGAIKPQKSPLKKDVIKEGGRNNFLAQQAGVYRAQGHEVEYIYALLLVDNSNFCDPPLDEREVERVAQSIGKKEKAGKLNIASRMVAYADAVGLRLFKTPENDTYARVPVGDHFEVWSVKSRSFSSWLSHLFYQEEGKAANREGLSSAKTVIEGRAQFDSPTHPVFTRIGKKDDKIFVDLADAQWRSLEIDAEGWRIVDDPPVMFLRGAGMLPLEEPSGDAYLDDILRPFINVEDDSSWTILASWLLMAVHPDGPYPVLVLHGEQGSSKSTVSKFFRSIIDPNEAPLRTRPRNERDLMIAAQNNWILTLDNISSLPDWMSDAICRLSTGGGFSTRALYTDDDEKLFTAKRPVIINGIEELATRSDLLDRSLIVYLPKIDNAHRMPESIIETSFDDLRPSILGALLDATSLGLCEQRAGIDYEDTERMADFFAWLRACESGVGWKSGQFKEAYRENRKSMHLLALEAWPVGNALISWFSEQDEWKGTASHLLTHLKPLVSSSVVRTRKWPKDATRLSGQLRRLAPNLRSVGIEVTFGRDVQRYVKLERVDF